MDKRHKVYKRNVSDKQMCEKESILLKNQKTTKENKYGIYFSRRLAKVLSVNI